jgi:methyl-accepting chemotaxis protein
MTGEAFIEQLAEKVDRLADQQAQAAVNVGILTEAVSNLKDATAALAEQACGDRDRGDACRTEVFGQIRQLREDLNTIAKELRDGINAVKTRAAYIGGALGTVGITAGALIAVFVKG